MRRLLILLMFSLLSPTFAGEPQVAAGIGHSLALTADGNVYSWGSDDTGQLGLARTLNRLAGRLVDLPAGAVVKAMAAGRGHSLALTSDGSVYSWGQNNYGQLGDGTTTLRSTPAKVNLRGKAIAVAAGTAHSLALLEDGTVWAWGIDENGELGDYEGELSTLVSSPMKVPDLPFIKQIQAGGSHSLALDSSGTVWSWGRNDRGQLGDEYGDNLLGVVKVTIAAKIALIAAGGDSSFAVDESGKAWSWGRGDNFQLGDGYTNDRAYPLLVPGLDKVASISISTYFVSLTRTNGEYWSWGGADQQTPTLITGFTQKVINVAHGEYHILVVAEDGKIYGLADNAFGQLGNGTLDYADEFTVAIGLPAIKNVATGQYHSLGLTVDGKLYAWGSNNQGALGEAAELTTNIPKLINNFNGVIQIVAGDNHSIALKSDGTVWAWGYNQNGAVGDATFIDRSKPVKIDGLSNIAKIRAGVNNSAAVGKDGSLWAWGSNFNGELAANPDDVFYANTPRKVTALTGVTDVAIGDGFMLALKSDATVWAWGYNSAGQLGTGDKKTSFVPAKVQGLSSVTAIAAGDFHGMALKQDGSVWSWGSNSSLQLGNADSPDSQPVPTQIKGLIDIKQIAGSYHFSAALGKNGKLYTWGSNYSGELGIESGDYSDIPVIADGDNFAAFATGSDHVMAVKSDGSTWSFGWNGYGQLGTGAYEDQFTYALVVNPTLTGFLNLSPSKPSLAIPAGKLPPFLVATTKIGTNERLTLNSDISLQDFLKGAAPLERRKPLSRASGGYNVYVAAIIPGAPATVVTPARPVAIFLKTLLAGWQPYLGGPLAEYLRGVSESSDKKIVVDILTSTDISALIGTKFLLGYGTDSDEMIRAGRYRVVYEVSKPK